MIEALLSRDPNKMKVYTDGYDSHSLNSFAYFGSEMPDITNTVESINSIKTLYQNTDQGLKLLHLHFNMEVHGEPLCRVQD